MHADVFEQLSTDAQANLYYWLFWEAITTFVWLVIDFFVITSQKSSSLHLEVNVALSKTMSDILVFLAGGVAFLGTMEWWLVIPVVGAMADDYIVSNRAIVNALQKPFGLQGPEGH